MSTEELIELLAVKENTLRATLREQSALLDTIHRELVTHLDLNSEMLADSNTNRIARIKAALVPFNIDTSTWTG